jgi:hypothetical protein
MRGNRSCGVCRIPGSTSRKTINVERGVAGILGSSGEFFSPFKAVRVPFGYLDNGTTPFVDQVRPDTSATCGGK